MSWAHSFKTFLSQTLVDCLLMFLCRFFVSVRCRRILGFWGRCRLRLGPAAINLNVIYNSFGPFHCGVLFSVGSSMDGAEWVTRPLNRLSSRTFEWLPWFIRLWFAGGKGHASQRPRGADLWEPPHVASGRSNMERVIIFRRRRRWRAVVFN